MCGRRRGPRTVGARGGGPAFGVVVGGLRSTVWLPLRGLLFRVDRLEGGHAEAERGVSTVGWDGGVGAGD